MFVRHVPVIRFTDRACGGFPVGHRMRMIGPKGKFMLEPTTIGPICTCPPGPDRAVHLDDPAVDGRREAAQDRAPQRVLVPPMSWLPAGAEAWEQDPR